MLNGIGGCTVAQAKKAMAFDEYMMWMAYREKHGSLNLGLRVEHGAALVAWSMQGGEFERFLPQRGGPQAISLEQAMTDWQ